MLFKLNLFTFVIGFLILGWLGVQSVTPLYTELALRFSQMYFLFFILLYFYSQSRNSLYSYIFISVLIFLISIYDILRINSDNYINLLIGLVLVTGFILFMFLSPLFTNLNKEKEVPERVT